ncbi:hypothetical protein HMPREF1546_00774 [Oscillibacter sp. KLE 1745]|nr:hypothetical protein HMPREF1546_00774 [Oscillibacter sp. KLE 1745]
MITLHPGAGAVNRHRFHLPASPDSPGRLNRGRPGRAVPGGICLDGPRGRPFPEITGDWSR